MEFLSTLDIDGISEHTQLFSLSHEQVNMVVKDTITNTVKQLKAKYKMNKTTVDNQQQQPGEIASLPPAEGGGKRWRISGEQTEIASKRPHFLYSNNPSYFHPPQPFSTVLNTVLSNPSLPDDDDDDDELSKSRSIIDLVSSSSDDDAELIEDWDAYEDYQRDNDIINESSQSTEMEEESQSVSDSTTPSPVSSKPPVSTLFTTHPATPVSTIPSTHPATSLVSTLPSTLPTTPPISTIPSTISTTPPISTIPTLPPISTHPTINNADTPDYLSSDSESDVFEIPEPKKKQSLPVFKTVESPQKNRLNTITPKPTIPVDTTIMDLDSSSQSDDDSVETVESTTNP